MIKQIKKILIGISLFYLVTCQMALVQEALSQQANVPPVMKELQGEVTWIRKDRIAVVYKKDTEAGSEEEILLPIDEKVSLEYIRSVSNISIGDTVYLQIEESVEQGPDGPRLTKKVKKISLVRKGNQKPIPATTVESPSEAAIEEGRILQSE
ncbi:MAG: hypothetical protein V1923_00200 [Candidatus Omnitrophota bacterium]